MADPTAAPQGYPTIAAAEDAAERLAANGGHRLRAWLREHDHAVVRSLAACARCDAIVEIRGDGAQGYVPSGAALQTPCPGAAWLN